MSGTVTTAEGARMLGVTPAVIRRWACDGKIRPVRPGVRPLRWRWDELVEVRWATRRDRGRLVAAMRRFAESDRPTP